MRIDRARIQRRAASTPGGRARRARRASHHGVLWLAVTLALGLLFSPAASASASAGVKRSCGAAPPPGHAACMAMRLLVGPSSSAVAQPDATRAAGPTAITNNKPFAGFLTPARLHEAYDLPTETAAGSTQTIAVVDAFNDPTAEADLAVYDKQFGLAPCTTANGCFKKVNQEGATSPLPQNEGGWATEISIDVQMARAICASCHILLVEAKTEEVSDLGLGVNAAVKAGATEISNSYGATEQATYSGLAKADYDHPGIAIVASSGDCGYLNKLCPEDSVGANFPASSPDVLSVGGTSLIESSGAWSSTAWEEGGSGCSDLFSAALWQSGLSSFHATGCTDNRAIADVSAIGDPNTGVDIYDSTPEEPGAPTGWGVWGGTSVAAPIVASELALAGGALGVSYPASTIYSHYGDPQALSDVTAGSNGTCGGATICKAIAGFDGPTGVGSPIGLKAFAVSGTPESTSPPSISGATEQGQTLTEHHGEWTGQPTSYAYQWERCEPSGIGCQPIAGATATTYTLTATDIGSAIRVRETAANSIDSESADSPVTATVLSDLPSITAFAPSAGITGSVVTVTGTGLGTATQVLVGKLAASFTVVSPTKIEVTVPSGATSGKVAITTTHGAATSKAKYAVTLSIKSFKATSSGTIVSIKGVGFNSSSTVELGGVPAASVTLSSKSKLKATVPAGAASGPITVTNSAAPIGTVSSAASFTP